MKNSFKRIIVVSFLMLLSISVAHGENTGAEPWELVYREGELSVYHDVTQPRPTYKGEGIVEANLFELLAVLSDVGKRIHWVKDLKESQILEGSVETKVIIYEQFHLPWPCDNRDSVVESVIKQDLKKLEVSVEYHEVSHPKTPARDGVIRMPVARGNMFFRYLDEKHSFARFVLGLDVGGHLPEWLVNYVVRKSPIVTLEGLLRQVNQTRGEYRDFIRTHQTRARDAGGLPVPH